MPSATSEDMRLTSSISLLLGITDVLAHFLWEAEAKAGLDMQKMYWRTVRNTRRQGAASDCYARLSP